MKPYPQLTYILTWQDLYLGLLYFLLILFIASRWRKHYYHDSPLKKFIFPGLILRMTGTIIFSLILNFYYGYGDTFSYYTGAHEIWQAFEKSPRTALEIIMNHPRNYSAEALEFAQHSAYTGFATPHYIMMRIAGVTGLLCFGSYMPIALVFALFSFWGTWMIFLVFNEAFPNMRRYMAITCLFIPSIIVWTTGIMKEPVCMFALGLCFYSFNNILKGRSIFKNIIWFISGAIILLNVKDYIFYVLLAAMIFWIYKAFIKRLHSGLTKTFIKGFIYLAIIAFTIYFFTADDNLVQQGFITYFKKAENLQNIMVSINRDYNSGSGYSLPTNDFSSGGILQSFLLSLNVALFRPYIWECNNPLMFLSFIESFFTTLFVIYLLFRIRPVRIYKSLSHPLMLFSLVFSLLMAALVGFTSFNFGTLIRYKTPFEPFIYTMFVIMAFNREAALPEENKKIVTLSHPPVPPDLEHK
jgi:hypothetical protein